MAAETSSYLVIGAMALATYLTRVLGPVLASRLPVKGRGEAFLTAIPGSILVSVVAPTVLASSPAEALAGLATLGVAIKTRSLLLAMVAGVAVVWVARLALG